MVKLSGTAHVGGGEQLRNLGHDALDEKFWTGVGGEPVG